MQLLLHEIKKVFTWRVILLVFLINLIIYFLFIEYYAKNYPNGRPERDLYNVAIEMINKYGTDIDEIEFKDFVNTYELKVKEADKYLQSRKEFVDAGIDTYEKFRNVDTEDTEKYNLVSKVMFFEGVDLFWELDAREYIIDDYKNTRNFLEDERNRAEGAKKERLNQIIEEEKYGVYPEGIMINYQDFILYVAIAVILSVVIVISPIFIKDRAKHLLDLQYSSKKGRRLYKTKVIAGLISSFIVMTILIVIYLGLYFSNHSAIFLNLPIYRFTFYIFWYDLTFSQYILLTVAAIYVLGFVFSLLALAFSNLMGSYVSLIGIQIPFVIAIITFGIPYLVSWIINIWVPKWIAPSSFTAMVVISIGFVIFVWIREKRKDIVL